MTTPVECDIDPGRMRFFVGRGDLAKDIKPSMNVKVKKMNPRLVVAIGIRGGYTKDRFHDHRDKLEEWVRKDDRYSKNGDAYGVYWNGPFIPGPLKRSEVHLPIQKKENNSSPTKSSNK